MALKGRDLTDLELDRYSRHILHDAMGVQGQEALCSASVMLVGCGGLGCAAALYLAAAGVGHLTLIDGDTVELSNLQRQPGHGMQSIGQNKAHSLAASCQAINPGCQVQALPEYFQPVHFTRQPFDLILDCTDHLDIRLQLNAMAHAQKRPLIYASAIGGSAQGLVFDFRRQSAPCLQCLWPSVNRDASPRCAEQGVLGPLVGMLGSWQALEAVKLLSACAPVASGLWLYDDQSGWRRFEMQPRADCPVCGRH